MNMSEDISKIAPAFLIAQKAIKFAVKDARNPHLKNLYADLPSVINAVKEALNNAGIAIIQTAGDTFDGKLTLATVLMHESGQWFRSDTTMPLPKQDPQGYGSAVTYARRYALSAITGLHQDDDDGNAASASESMMKAHNAEEYQAASQKLVSVANESQVENVYKWLGTKPPLDKIKQQIEKLTNENRKQETS